MRVFISHSNRDAELARALIDLLQAALPITGDDTRCSSLDGYRLPGGVSVDQQLRFEVHDAKLVIGLLTPNSLRSAYVAFELGARWGAEKPMIPLLASGITPDDLEGPLAGINALDCRSASQIHQLVEESALHLEIAQNRPSTFTHQVSNLSDLASSVITAPDESRHSFESPGLLSDQKGLYDAVKTRDSDHLAILKDYCVESRKRWREVVSDEPGDSQALFPNGYYEMGFAIVDAVPVDGLGELKNRLRAARKLKHSGWPPFLEMHTDGWRPYPQGNSFIEAWTGSRIPGRPAQDAAFCDFWRASTDGQLYTIRGYLEDSMWNREHGHRPGEVFDTDLPIMRLAEGILFASRFAEEFEQANDIVVKCRFTGLRRRSLLSLGSPIGMLWKGDYVSLDSEADIKAQRISLRHVRENLPVVILNVLSGLYVKFNFFDLSEKQVQSAVDRLGRF